MSADEGFDHRALLVDASQDKKTLQADAVAQRAAKFLFLTAMLCLSGAANDLLAKIVANMYTQRFAFFVDQGNNIVYAFFSGIPVVWFLWRGEIPRETRECPQRKFAMMGLLDAFGTYFSSVGAVHTPGQLQIVLGQALIPISMLASAVLLGSRYSAQEVFSALVVLAGACIAVGPAFLSSGTLGSQCWPIAIVIYALSNVPMALSNVYKELGFADMQLDVFYLTFVVVVYQTFLSFGLLICQTIPYLSGSAEGLSLSTAWEDFAGGFACFAGLPPEDDDTVECNLAGPLLVAYVVVNLGFNMIGLLLVKAGSDLRIGAVLCSLAYAVKLPVSTILFSSSLLMGRGTEPICMTTWVGLLLVLSGFVWYVQAGKQRAALDEEAQAEEKADPGEASVRYEEPWGFHERVVGCVATAAVRPREEHSRSPSKSPTKKCSEVTPRKLFNSQDDRMA